MIVREETAGGLAAYDVELRFAPSIKLVTKVRRFVASLSDSAVMGPALNAKAVTVNARRARRRKPWVIFEGSRATSSAPRPPSM